MSSINYFSVGHSVYSWDAGLTLFANKARDGEWRYNVKLDKVFYKDFDLRAIYNVTTTEYDVSLGMKLFDKYRFRVGYGQDRLRLRSDVPISDNIKWYSAGRYNFNDDGIELSSGLCITITTGRPQRADKIHRRKIEWLD